MSGTEPVQATIKTRPIDSTDRSPINVDTLFIWVPHVNDFYGVILSKNPCIDQNFFSKVTNMFSSASNNMTFVLLNGCCNSHCSY
jgi:hypothetical protein